MLTKERKAFLHTVFTTALEGGINDWAAVEEYKWMAPSQGVTGPASYAPDVDGFHAIIVSSEDDWGVQQAFVSETGKIAYITDTQSLRVDLDVMNRGVNMLVDKIIEATKSEDPEAACSLKYLRQFVVAWLTDGEDGDYDIIAADLSVQFGLFGEHVYS